MKTKKTLSIFTILAIAHFFSYAQTGVLPQLNGAWQGIVVSEKDTQMVVLDISVDPKLEITFSMPWSAITLNAIKAKWINDSLTFSVSQLACNFIGAVDFEKMNISGILIQKKNYPLTLTKTNNPVRMKRPQTPADPYPYSSEEVTIQNKKAKVTLSGTLTLPKGTGPFPAVVLITGSGPQTRDEDLSGHKPFLVIADYLTRNGIAVLRYDDRGVGKSTGKFHDATTLDLATDAEAVFNFLKSDKRIDKTKIGMIGHSEGGIIAPIVASRNKGAKFIIMLAGSGVDGKELMLEQYRLILKASSIPDSIVTPLVDLNQQAFEAALTIKDATVAKAKIREITINSIQKLGEETAKKYKLSKVTAEQLILQIYTPWMIQFLQLNPTDYLQNVNCPILALNGELDLQVSATQNLPAIKKAVCLNKKGKLTTMSFPKLNHLFQTCTTGSPSEYPRIEETINETVLKKMVTYILEL